MTAASENVCAACVTNNQTKTPTLPEMTPEQKRIAIAKACGWTDCEHIESLGLCKGIHKNVRDQYDSGHSELPDYLNDLNAMHKAEATMGDPQLWMEYEDNLAKVMNHVGWIWHATAAQRAEAFGKTLNLW